MKKLLLVLILFVVAITASSQNLYWGTADKVTIDYGNGYGEWKDCSIRIKVDSENHQVKIFSELGQIFNYETLEKVELSEFTVYEAYAKDENGTTCMVSHMFSSRAYYVIISYSDVKYMYSVILDKN